MFGYHKRICLKNYIVMMVAEKDFYLTKSCSPTQLEFEGDDQKLTACVDDSLTSAGRLTVNPMLEMTTNLACNGSRVTLESQECSRDAPDMFLEASHVYGWNCASSKSLQRLNRPVWFLAFLCLLSLSQGLVVIGVTYTVLTSVEKQFGFTSTTVGLFGSSYDIAYGVCCTFVGYVGHYHKPRWLGFGALLMAFGCVVLSLPKFIFGSYAAGSSRDIDVCRAHNSTVYMPECDADREWYYAFLFILGNVLIGIGATPLFTLGPAHINDIVERGQGSMYMGIMYASSALGPAIGFMIGNPILSTWVDLKQPPGSNLRPDDRNWVGAWWIGYLAGAGILLVPVIPLLGFPRLFPNTEAVRNTKRDLEDTVPDGEHDKHVAKSAWAALKTLLQNRPFLLICLASASESLTIGGLSTFFPKFIETQFHFTASESALYAGIIVVPGAAGGIFVGGYLSKRYKWNCSRSLKAASVMGFISVVFVLSALIGCKDRHVVGGDQPYYGSSSIHLDDACRGLCNCSVKYYKPICTVADQMTYFSPCHAGCTTENHSDQGFINCSCFAPGAPLAVNGRCTPDCNLFPVFAVSAFLLMFFTFMNNVPFVDATLRVVPESQGSFAMGFQQVFVRFLGFIPAPAMFGKLIDRSCKLWQEEECTHSSTSCLEYDNKHFRYYITTLAIVFKFLSFLFIFWAYKTYKLPREEEKGDKLRNARSGNAVNLHNFALSSSCGKLNIASEPSVLA